MLTGNRSVRLRLKTGGFQRCENDREPAGDAGYSLRDPSEPFVPDRLAGFTASETNGWTGHQLINGW